MASTLTRDSSIGAWLDHPVGGPVIRELLAQAGQTPEALAPVRPLAIKQLVAMSRGAMTDEMVDGLVQRVRAESGTDGDADKFADAAAAVPAEWTEQVT